MKKNPGFSEKTRLDMSYFRLSLLPLQKEKLRHGLFGRGDVLFASKIQNFYTERDVSNVQESVIKNILSRHFIDYSYLIKSLPTNTETSGNQTNFAGRLTPIRGGVPIPSTQSSPPSHQ